MTATLLPKINTDYLDTLFGWPVIRPVPAAELKKIPQDNISVWCWKRGVYQVPTTELIEFLTHQIGDPSTKALEIGAGNGCIGRALGIPMIDNRMQEWPEIRMHYKLMGQPTITYGPDVKTMPADKAVDYYAPQVVIGCWITELYTPVIGQGNPHGVDEAKLLAEPSVDKYVLVGNQTVHGLKSIKDQFRYTNYQFD